MHYKYLMAIAALLVILPFEKIQAENLNNNSEYNKIEQKSEILKDGLSTDDRPIFFSIMDVNYKVPRNYITHMDNWNGGPQELVKFKLTFPNFEPLTEKTKDCLTAPRAYWPKGCAPIEFWVNGKDGLSDDDHFNNARNLFHSQVSQPGPAGFEMYETGPENARVETYRKKTLNHTILIDCIGNKQDEHGIVTCENYGSPLFNGNGLSYILDYNRLEDAEKIDYGIRSLLSSFTLKEEKR